MRRVFNYNEYLNESMKKEAKDALINSFFSSLSEVLYDLDYLESYNLLCRWEKDLDARYDDVLKNLNKAGWTKNALDELFLDHGAEIAKIYNTESYEIDKRIVSDIPEVKNTTVLPNGTADYVLYKLSDGKVWLSGYRTSEGDFGEKYFRFAYGYATEYKYGKMALAQDYGSMSDYVDVLGKEFPKLFDVDIVTDPIYSPGESLFGMPAVKKSYEYKDGIGTWDLNELIKEIRPQDGIKEIMPDVEEILSELGLKDSYKIKDGVITIYWNKKLKDIE